MTRRLQMKSITGGGYFLTVGEHTFKIELNTDKIQGAYGPIANREYTVFVDDTRVGDTFKTAAEAKDFVAPYVERAQEQERRERATEMWRQFAEDLFPAGIPKNVLSAMEKYTNTITVGDKPKTPKGKVKSEAKDTKTEGTPDTAEVKSEPESTEDVAAKVRKSTPRRSRAKSTSKTTAEKRGTTPRRRTSKVKSEDTAEPVEVKSEEAEPVAPEPEVTAPPEPEPTEVSAPEREAASA